MGPGGQHVEVIRYHGPVRVHYGMRDEEVPFAHVMRTLELMGSEDVLLSAIKQGDHRLSSHTDVQRLFAAFTELTDLL